MSDRQKILAYSILTMASITIAVSAVTIHTLYKGSFHRQEARLVEMARSWARIIETLADPNENQDLQKDHESVEAAMLRRIREVHEDFETFGRTVEFTVVRRENDRIVFLFSHRHANINTPDPIPHDSVFGEPIRLAVGEKSGTVVGLDYRGQMVLAAYEPVAPLDLGVVAKIDLKEIRAPFVRITFVSSGVALLLILVGGIVMVRINGPLIERLEKSEARQQELARANAKLEEAERIAKRQAELLRRQSQELGRSNSELEHFAHMASHDLQEPLRTVGGFTQLLRRRCRGKLDPEAEKLITYVLGGVKEMQQLIEDLLAFSRVASRRDEFQITNSEEAFQRSLETLQAAIDESAATVTHDPLPVVTADARQLAQLFQNLIGNALKYRGEATPVVHVSAERKGDEWHFSVRDNGIGIDPQFGERIFEMFQRLHSSEKYPGTGLGLAICRKIVEYHGGKIWVESAPGQGSTFYFSLPDRPKEAETAQPLQA